MDKRQLRKWNRSIHRDLGYLCFGLTVIYAISGIAVNHVQDWNPNYHFERKTAQIAPLENFNAPPAELATEVLQRLGLPEAFKNTFFPQPGMLRIFAPGNTINVDLKTGEVIQEISATRSGLYEMNFLHLNHPKRWWTYFADIYAISLLLLAITGLFILKGKQGISGRGAWLTLAGILIPLIFLWVYL